MLSPVPTDPTAVGRRLASRLQEKGWGFKEFQERVREAADGARGTSYGSVWAYVHGEVAEPRPRVVAAMADVLGLTPEWLVTGVGPRTAEEAARLEVATAVPGEEPGGPRPRARDLVRAMERARTRLPRFEAELLSRRDHVLEDLVIDLFRSGGRELDSFGEGEVAEAVTLVAWLLTLPLRMLDPDDRAHRLSDGDAYVLAMAAVVRMALPAPSGGQPFGILSRLRRLRRALGDEARGEPARERVPREGDTPH